LTVVLLCVLAAHAHTAFDTDDDGWQNQADCAPKDPTTFPGARERCDGIDNDCDRDVDEDGACVDEVMPCYQVETASQPALDGDPCLLATDPNAGGGCGSMADSGEAFFVFGFLALRRRRRSCV
jgi:hypothetical protein